MSRWCRPFCLRLDSRKNSQKICRPICCRRRNNMTSQRSSVRYRMPRSFTTDAFGLSKEKGRSRSARQRCSNMQSKLDAIPNPPMNRRIRLQLQSELATFVAKVREGQRATDDPKRVLADALRFQHEVRERLRHLQQHKRRRLSQ